MKNTIQKYLKKILRPLKIWSGLSFLLIALSACQGVGTEVGNPPARCLSINVLPEVKPLLIGEEALAMLETELMEPLCGRLVACGAYEDGGQCKGDLFFEENSSYLPALGVDLSRYDYWEALLNAILDGQILIDENELIQCSAELMDFSCENLIDLPESPGQDLPMTCADIIQEPSDNQPNGSDGDPCV